MFKGNQEPLEEPLENWVSAEIILFFMFVDLKKWFKKMEGSEGSYWGGPEGGFGEGVGGIDAAVSSVWGAINLSS